MEKVQKTINKLGISIKYVVSDRAKPLIKLALKGIGCQSIPDLFHASNEIVKLLGDQNKFARQIAAIASLIDAWWLWVMESLDDYEVDDECKKWLLDVLLPAIYWQSQAAKTKNPKLKIELSSRIRTGFG